MSPVSIYAQMAQAHAGLSCFMYNDNTSRRGNTVANIYFAVSFTTEPDPWPIMECNIVNRF